MTKFYTDDKFGLLIDLHSMADQTMHGNGTRLVNTTHGIHLEIEWDTKGLSILNYHIFVILDSQFNIMGRQLESVQR